MRDQRSSTAQPLRDAEGRLVAYGLMDDGMTAYIPGINCVECGRFVGRDGWISVGYFEMSSEVAYVEGVCGRHVHG